MCNKEKSFLFFQVGVEFSVGGDSNLIDKPNVFFVELCSESVHFYTPRRTLPMYIMHKLKVVGIKLVLKKTSWTNRRYFKKMSF